jgi:putative endonuclease
MNFKSKNLETGKLGERIAKRYLQDKKYRIAEENYKTKYAEIDLIAHKKDILIFVEVKTKIGEQFGSPEDSINRDKMKRLKRSAHVYAVKKRYAKRYRIDAICIVLDKEREASRINHYENITG